MSGHSHWSTIKHKKGEQDAKRGKIFSKLARAIMIAVKQGGEDPDHNLALKYALDKAREASMPKASMERALKRYSADGHDQTDLIQLLYEGYGPGGVAIMVEILTDNRNRTASDIRKVFDSRGGNLGESGCVSFLFEKKGLISIDQKAALEEPLMELALNAGADDLEVVDETYRMTCALSQFEKVKAALTSANISYSTAEITYLPKTTMQVDAERGRKILKLIEILEDHDDVQNVYSNCDIPEELVRELQSQ